VAVSGSAGLTPSVTCRLNWKGELSFSGSTVNRPRNIVYSDIVQNSIGTIEDAVPLLASGKTVNVDVRELQVTKLKGLLSAI
jgi:hypothetical protein